MTVTAAPAQHETTIAGLSLSFDQAGSGDQVVVVHHSTGPLWSPFLDRMSATYQVLALHLPGYGRSQRPGTARSPRDLAVLTLQWLDALDLTGVDVVGLGLGGWVAAEMATMNQRLFRTLTFVGAAGIKPAEGFIHDPMLGSFEDYVRFGFADQRRFNSLFGDELDPAVIELWDFQHFGYMFKVHVDETEELAYETGRKMIEGAGNLFLDGSNGKPNPWAQNLPGLNSRGSTNQLPTAQYVAVRQSRGVGGLDSTGKAQAYTEAATTPEEHDARRRKIFDGILARHACVVGTPDSVVPKIRHVLEMLRPGSVIFWHGDGDFTHEETVRGVRLMGEHVLPAVREMAKELELFSPFEVDPVTNRPVLQAVPS